MSEACHHHQPDFDLERHVTIPELFLTVKNRVVEAQAAQVKNKSYRHFLHTRDEQGRPLISFVLANDYDQYGRRTQRQGSDEFELSVPVLEYSESDTAVFALDELNADRRFFKFIRFSDDHKRARWWEIASEGYEEFGDLSVEWPDRGLSDLLFKLQSPDYEVVPIAKLREQ